MSSSEEEKTYLWYARYHLDMALSFLRTASVQITSTRAREVIDLLEYDWGCDIGTLGEIENGKYD